MIFTWNCYRPYLAVTREGGCLQSILSACEVMPAELGERIGDLAAIAVAAYWDEKQ